MSIQRQDKVYADDAGGEKMNWKHRICEKTVKFQEEYGNAPNVIINPEITEEEIREIFWYTGDEGDLDFMRDICAVNGEEGKRRYVEFEKEHKEQLQYKEECIEMWRNKEGGEIFGMKIIYDDSVKGEIVENREGKNV